ncbi:MAG: molybdate ABC transporter substrate-binding protein [Eubacteriales bacterium]|nr:molybdate ABC transporter substrate-binding protein [Eubacteriales bacterium]MDY3332733.1 molybdate ABC transporter substrate-binding protein [Gallibacter sp.]
MNILRKIKGIVTIALVVAMSFGMTACSSDQDDSLDGKKYEINLFVAASMSKAMEDLKADFEKENPNITIVINADSSGKLKTQILEGFDSHIFLSASKKEIKELSEKNMTDKDSELDLLENQLAIIAHKDYNGGVKDIATIKNAKSISLAYGSVPVGFYARKAMIKQGILNKEGLDDKAIKKIPGSDVASALGGITISEKDNVSSVLNAVAEKSTEIGFAYTSDVKRNENVKIISKVDKKVSGEITYPIAKITNKELSKDQKKAVDKLYKFLISDKAKKVYEKYGFTAK